MVCLVCGSKTSPGSHMCGRCFKRVGDPLLMGASALDPMADQRMLSHGSVVLMIGPSFMGDVRVGKGLDPGLTFDRMISSEDRSHVPSFIDRYLADIGIDMVLRGDEMLPRREFISRMVYVVGGMDLADERWARPSLRMGNIISLAIRETNSLPIEPNDSYQMINDLTSLAEKFYSKAIKDPMLERTARGNLALMRHWKGSSEEALASLLGLWEEAISDDDKAEIALKRALVLRDIGKKVDALASLNDVPTGRTDARIAALRATLEG